MGGFASVVRGALAGINDAAGNTQTVQQLEAANEREREAKQAQLRAQIVPHGVAIKGLQQKLSTLDPQKNPLEYNATVDEIQQNIHAMRTLLHPDAKLGAGDWLKTHTTDRLHITNHDKRVREAAAKNAAGIQQDYEAAKGIAQGTVPFAQTPTGQSLAYQRETQKEVAAERATMREYTSPDGLQRNWFRPGDEPTGWNATAGAAKAGKPMVVRLPNGQAGFATPQPDGSFKDQQGNTVQATPFPKPPTPQIKSGMSQGRNVYALLTPDGWVDAGSKQPLPDFHPSPTFAQTGLWGLDTAYDQAGNPTAALVDRRSGRMMPAPPGLVMPLMAKDIETARTTAIAADNRLRLMEGAADKAKAGDQQAMLAITANHIGMTLGAQKGARINQAVWNEAVESAPWLQNVEKSFGPDGYLSGVKLSPQQIDQMVDLGKLARQAAWESTVQQAAANGVAMEVPEFQLHPAGMTPPAGPKTKDLKHTRGNQNLNKALDDALNPH